MQIKKILIDIFIILLALILTIFAEWFVLKFLIESNHYIIKERTDDLSIGAPPWLGCEQGFNKLAFLLEEYKNKNNNLENIIHDKEIKKTIMALETAFCGVNTSGGYISNAIRFDKNNACVAGGYFCVDSEGNIMDLVNDDPDFEKTITCGENNLCYRSFEERGGNATENQNLYNTFKGDGFSFNYPNNDSCVLEEDHIGYYTYFFLYNSLSEVMDFLETQTDYTKDEIIIDGLKAIKTQYVIHNSNRRGFMTIIPINENKVFKIVYEPRGGVEDCSLEAYDLAIKTFKID